MGLQLLENDTLVFLSKDGKSIRYGFTRKGLFIDRCAFNAYSHSKHHRKANNTDTYMFRKMARKELKKRGLTLGTKYTHSRNNNLLRTNVEGINFDEYGIYNNAMQYLYYKGEWAKPYEAIYCDDWSSIDLDCPQYVFFGKEKIMTGITNVQNVLERELIKALEKILREGYEKPLQVDNLRFVVELMMEQSKNLQKRNPNSSQIRISCTTLH